MKERKSTFPLDRKARNTYNEQDGFFIEATEKELNFDDEICICDRRRCFLKGFDAFLEEYKKLLPAEKAAVAAK